MSLSTPQRSVAVLAAASVCCSAGLAPEGPLPHDLSLACRYAQFVDVLDACSRDNLEFVKDKAVKTMYDLLRCATLRALCCAARAV